MKKFFLLFFPILLGFSLFFPSNANAQITCTPFSPQQVDMSDQELNMTIGPTLKNKSYAVAFKSTLVLQGDCYRKTKIPGEDGSISINVKRNIERCMNDVFLPGPDSEAILYEEVAGSESKPICKHTITVGCSVDPDPFLIDLRTDLYIRAIGVSASSLSPVKMKITGPSGYEEWFYPEVNNGVFRHHIGTLPLPGPYAVELLKDSPGFLPGLKRAGHCPSRVLVVGERDAPIDNQPPPGGGGGTTPNLQVAKCDLATGKENPAGEGLLTAVGCIPFTGANTFVSWFLKWAIGIAGGIAFLLIVFSGFQIMTASGNPEKLQNGRELLTAAISGLILIIFSVFLLKLIGVTILQIPGF